MSQRQQLTFALSYMRRRELLVFGAGTAVAWPYIAKAASDRLPRVVGVLMGFGESDPASRALVAEFRAALVRLGWEDGRNLRIEVRWGAGDAAKMGTLAKELVKLHPDAILGQTTPAATALANQTKTIPIVFVTVSDPIGSGLAGSLTHPGGNLTGFTFVESEMGGKWVELLKEIAPSTQRIGLLFNPATAPPLKFYMPSIEAAAASLGIKPSTAPVRKSEEVEDVVAAQSREPGGSLIVMPDAFNAANRELIIGLAARYRVPALYGNDFVDSGGLIFYASDFAESYRLAAGYIDRILKGMRPGDLPIQLPTKFVLSLNLKTANALGLNVPLSLRQRADEVIE